MVFLFVIVEDKSTDWSAEDKEEKKMLQPKFENVMVATVGDDGTARIWYPLQVGDRFC